MFLICGKLLYGTGDNVEKPNDENLGKKRLMVLENFNKLPELQETKLCSQTMSERKDLSILVHRRKARIKRRQAEA